MSTHSPFGATQITTAVLIVATLATTFLPWARSGQRARSSYELVEVAGNAGVIPSQWQGVAPMWFLLPVLCAGTLFTLFATFERLPGLLSATIGVIVAGTAILVLRSPLVPLLGGRVAIAAGAACASWGIALVVKPQLFHPKPAPIGPYGPTTPRTPPQ